jgi:hypothetical protein
MTFQEMKTRAEILFEAIDSDDVAGFTDNEWTDLFNQAQYKVVLEILNDGIARNSFNRRAIDPLIQTDNVAGTLSVSGSSPKFTVTLTDEIWWVLKVTASVTIDGNSYTDILVDSISYDEYHANKDNPFKNPDKDERYWRYPLNNDMIVITDSVTSLDDIEVEYVRLASSINASGDASELHESVHPAIVEVAVRLAHKSLEESTGYQLQALENDSPSIT